MENADLKLQTPVTLLFSDVYSNSIFCNTRVLQKQHLKNVDFRTMISQTNSLKYSAPVSPSTLAGAQHTQTQATCILLSKHEMQSVNVARATQTENDAFYVTFFLCLNGPGRDGEKNTPIIL